MAKQSRKEKWKILALMLTLINTFLAALVAGLEVDAGIRASGANRDSQYLAIEASGFLVKNGHQSNYDFSTYTQLVKLRQEALVLEFTELDPDLKGETSTLEDLGLQAALVKARSDALEEFSIFITDERYMSPSSDDIPDLMGYLEDMTFEAQELVERQNAAADEYARWDGKTDSYVAVLAMLAIAFFLLGLAQALDPEERLLLSLLAAAIMGAGGLWTGLIYIS